MFFDVFKPPREAVKQQRREFSPACWAMIRAEPWRLVTLPISLTLVFFLAWEMDQEHSQTFWWLTAFGASAISIGNARLALYLRARWECKQQREENR